MAKSASKTKAAKKAPAKKTLARKKTARKKTARKAAKKAVSQKKTVKQTIDKKASRAATKKAAKKILAGKTGCVISRVDVGWGNSLYIRGNGAGLSWAKGVHMTSAAANEWLWTSPKFKNNIEFKILINDVYWSEGENYVANIGKVTIITPSF